MWWWWKCLWWSSDFGGGGYDQLIVTMVVVMANSSRWLWSIYYLVRRRMSMKQEQGRREEVPSKVNLLIFNPDLLMFELELFLSRACFCKIISSCLSLSITISFFYFYHFILTFFLAFTFPIPLSIFPSHDQNGVTGGHGTSWRQVGNPFKSGFSIQFKAKMATFRLIIKSGFLTITRITLMMLSKNAPKGFQRVNLVEWNSKSAVNSFWCP